MHCTVCQPHIFQCLHQVFVLYCIYVKFLFFAVLKPPERAPSPAPAVHDTGSDPYKESAQRGTVHAPAPDRLEARKKSELEYQRLWKEVHGNKKVPCHRPLTGEAFIV